MSVKEKEKIEKYTQMAWDFFEQNIDSNKFVFNENLWVTEGGDGTGKTSLVSKLGTYMFNKESDHKVVVLRGSGTTGTQELITWAKQTKSQNKEFIEDLNKILNLQNTYTLIATQPNLDWQQVWSAGEKMHMFMFQTIDKYLQQGYQVISDRGIVSFLLTIAERADEELFKQTFSKILQTCGHINVGRQILVDSPLEATVQRVVNKDGMDKNLARKENYTRSYDFLIFFNHFRKKYKDKFYYIENIQDRPLDAVLVEILKNINLRSKKRS